MEYTGPLVRKGKAMLHTYTQSTKCLYRPYDLQGTFMPSVKKTEWLISVCLFRTGSSGYLEPGLTISNLE